MKVRMGTFEIPEELRLAVGRMFFEPYYKEDAFGNQELVTHYDKTPAGHTVIQQYLKEYLFNHIDDLVRSEVELDKEKYLRAYERSKRRLEIAKRKADLLQKRLSPQVPTTRQAKNPLSQDIL